MKIRFHGTLAALAVTAVLLPMQAQAAPTDMQLCESAITAASAKFPQLMSVTIRGTMEELNPCD